MIRKTLLAVAALALFATSAFAQAGGSTVNRTKNLTFARYNSNGVQFLNLADGTKAGSGVAIAAQDTSTAIDVSDWFYRRSMAVRATSPAGASGDSCVMGTLTITGTSSTIDTFVVSREVSSDGFVWSVPDSQVAHISSANTMGGFAVGTDSVRVVGTSITVSPLVSTSFTKASITYSALPGAGSANVTAQAMFDVNYVRFRIHMTSGDAAAAGSTGGFSATWTYPVGLDSKITTP